MTVATAVKLMQFNLPAGLKSRFVRVTREHGRMSTVLRMFVGLYCLAKEGYDRPSVMLMAEFLLYGDKIHGQHLARKLLDDDNSC